MNASIVPSKATHRILTEILKLDKVSGLALVTWRVVELQKEQGARFYAHHTPWKDRFGEKGELRAELEQVRRALSNALAFRSEQYRSSIGSIALGGAKQTRAQKLADEIRRFIELSIKAEEDVIIATGDRDHAKGLARKQLEAVVSAYQNVRNWLFELELAFFREFERSLPSEELARLLRPFFDAHGSHAANTLAKSAARGGGSYRQRMIYGIQTPSVPPHPPPDLHDVAHVSSFAVLLTLLKVDAGTGLTLSTLRLAELAADNGPSARETEHRVDGFRREDFPDAFRRGEAQMERLQMESLAAELVKKVN
ncbi:hypothetical protein Rt10032_c17g5791 [Rhodotorula toruloides]|uniref:Uncharacterized protein n=1 Tax=Rhodotorula toruloides TaxID=5286 RepID=A0A511KQH9_RHOTO|nr:hypothetical protein Rt10032_c17g5791 [Rhodotorula toruloides]